LDACAALFKRRRASRLDRRRIPPYPAPSMASGANVLGSVRGALRRWGVVDRSPMKGFLRGAKGVIHVGAHTGQERRAYAQYKLDALWIEPIPELFAVLRQNLAGFPRQRAVNSLVTDRDGAEYTFHITSNEGGSSSIFPLAQHEDIWPDVKESATITVVSKT